MAYEYWTLATGAMSFCLNESLNGWDHAAGVLIHAEAGRYAAVLGGEPYRPIMTKSHVLIAPDKVSWQVIADAL